MSIDTATSTCGCGGVLHGILTRSGTEVKVADHPLSNPYGFEDIGLVCPHGVRWWAIPSGVQIATWRRDDA